MLTTAVSNESIYGRHKTLTLSVGFSIIAPSAVAIGGDLQQAVVGQELMLRFSVTPTVLSADNITIVFTSSTNAIDISDGSEDPFRSVSSDRLSIIFDPVFPSHEGIYTLTASNENGSDSASISLNVLGKPYVMFYLKFYFG